MSSKKVVMLLFVPLAISGCKDENDILIRSEFQQGYIHAFDKSNATPDSLIQQIEDQYIQTFRQERTDILKSDAEIAASLPRKLLEVDVYLKEETSGTLTSDTFYGMPPGGGTIDLASVVKRGQGVFRIYFRPQVKAEELSMGQMRAYYVSNAETFEVSGKKFGAGCGKYFDITEFFQRDMNQHGLELVASENRYLGQALGSFYFILVDLRAVHIASVSVIDSRYPKAHCQTHKIEGSNGG